MALPPMGKHQRQSPADMAGPTDRPRVGERPVWWPPEILQPLGEARAADIVAWLDPSVAIAIQQATATLRRLRPGSEPHACRASIYRLAMSRLDGLNGTVPIASVTAELGGEVMILTIGLQRTGHLAIRQTWPQVRGARWRAIDLSTVDAQDDSPVART